MVSYSDDGKIAEFNGSSYTRDDITGYYLNSTTRTRLHRAVYEFVFGEIPRGMAVHHIDGNKGNNEPGNLQLINAVKHAVFHNAEKTQEQRQKRDSIFFSKAREAAKAWHSSEAGRAWHLAHYQQMKDRLCSFRGEQRVCKVCGKQFDLTSAHQLFCSNKCKSAARRAEGTDNVHRTCEFCGKDFVTNRYGKTRFCSKTCSNLAIPRLPGLKR